MFMPPSQKRKKAKAKSGATPQTVRVDPRESAITQRLQRANQQWQAGQMQQAEHLYRQVLDQDPDNAQAYSMLGIMAGQSGQMDRAIQLTEKAIQLAPRTSTFHYNLGIMFKECGRLAEAVASYQKAVATKPDHGPALYNLGNALQALGKVAEAMSCYRQVVTIMPGHAEAHHNLGILLAQSGLSQEASTCYRQAVSLAPDYAEAYTNLGVVLAEMGQLEEAEACHRRALSLKPDLADAHYNLGIVFKDQGRFDAAIGAYRAALALQPDEAEILNNLGNALGETGQYDAAIVVYRQALALQPDTTELLNNLGNALAAIGQLDEARACHQRVITLAPDDVQAWNNFLLNLQYAPVPSPAALLQQYLQFAAQFEAPLRPSWESHANTRDPEKRLRIGYVSADFRQHSVAYFIAPILAQHHRERVEVFCYYNHKRRDDFTRRMAATAEHWTPCFAMSDEQLARRIRADHIDILVDLAGHTHGNRLLVFARKPAPIQVSWIGYPDTTGLAAMDYRLTDIHADPVGHSEQWHTETLCRLPNSFLCYTPPPDSPAIVTPPVQESGMITLASFNNLSKINEEVVALWAAILLALPAAQLLLKSWQSSCESVRHRLWQLFARQGVAPEQIRFASLTKSAYEHLGLYGSVDIALDPFPYNGTTTTCEALWMGVPVITLAGTRHAARVGVSILSTLGLAECIAANKEDYVQRAVQLATDRDRLHLLRATMRERMSASPLLDAKGFTCDLEAAYRAMWRRWCLAQ